MNIGLFTDTYYPQINGVVTSVKMLETQLRAMGHQVFIFTANDPLAPRHADNVFRLPSMPLTFLPNHRVAIMYSPKLMLNMKKLRLDIVHTHTEFPLGIFGKLVSEIYRIPMIHTYHTMYEDYVHYILNGNLITPKLAKRFSRVSCNRAKVVIAPADKTYNYLRGIGVKRPIKTIPTGIDFSPFCPENISASEIARTKSEIGLNLTDPVIISIGRLAKEKSLDVLINMMPEVLKSVPNAKLVIIGDGPFKSCLKELALSLGVQNSVLFPGARPWEAIGKYYRIGDVFATASTSETQGLTYIEAMAAKVPVAVRKDPSFEGVIKHGETGYVFDKPQDAAAVIIKALNNRAEALYMADKGYEAIQHLSAKHFGNNIKNVYMAVKEAW